MTHSGTLFYAIYFIIDTVLIPLLLDDPLWEIDLKQEILSEVVLIPLLLDDPLWARQNHN